jgi:hypothetical protein
MYSIPEKNDGDIFQVLCSYSEMQWRERQFTLSFTYRFNSKKNEREQPAKSTR